MFSHYTQVFLIIWILAFWIIHFLSYGKIEGKYEQSIAEKYNIRSIWGMFFGLAFIIFSLNIIIYFFYYPSRSWLRIWPDDFFILNIIAIVLMLIAFFLYLSFTLSAGKAIKKAFDSNEQPGLLKTGIYKYIRNPGYLAFYLAAIGCLLIFQNMLTFLIFIYICIVTYGHTISEEKKLLKIYGQEYEEYKAIAGRFLPKIKKK